MITRIPVATAPPRRASQRRPLDPSTLSPGRPVGLLARLRPGALDRALIAGADPARSRPLAARARLLTSSRNRAALAAALERLPGLAAARPSRFRLRPSEQAVAANEELLRELGVLLRADAPVYAGGVADVAQLISDGVGPLFRGDALTLERRLLRARASMLGAAPSDTAAGAGSARSKRANAHR
jgi:hypothetical protein